MRIFVTGATGFVGSAVVRDLARAGHQVVGLARSEASAAAVEAAGAEAHRGDLGDLEGLGHAAAAADGVIHTAFDHDFSRFKENSEVDRRVIEALGAALAGSGRPLVVTSAIGVLPKGRLATEDARPAPGANPRAASEAAADAVAARGGRVTVVRLPPSVHGTGDHAFVPTLIDIARRAGVSVYAGDGLNRWPAVHRLDAARLFGLALEMDEPGVRLHAVAEEGVPFRLIAEAIGRGLGVPCERRGPEEAAAHFGSFAHFADMDVPAASQATRDATGWGPREPGLLADLDGPDYFGG